MLNRRDREGLEISQFVFHILKKEDEAPTYLDEVILTNQQKRFFNKWLSESISLGVEFEFRDKERDGSVYKICSNIGQDNRRFIDASKDLSSEFKRWHKGSSSDGILVIALAQLSEGNALFLVKMNYSETLQYELENRDGRMVAVLKEVANPINESKQAIQKAAIININSNYEWEVFAQDKQNTISYQIADYFEGFLDVREKEVASVLTRQVFSAVSKWAKRHKNEIDPEQNHTDYKGRASDYLNLNDEFDTDSYVKAVIKDDNEERRDRLENSLRNYLEQEDLAGRIFQVKRGSIPKREAKITWTTHNDVKITFEGTPESNNITEDSLNNEKIITIRTSRIMKS